MKFFLSTIIIFIFTSLNVLNAKELKIDEIKNLNYKVFFMRHALAPGFGDPENFKLDDCFTQRNLSSDGINQARKISNVFTKYDLKFTKVYSANTPKNTTFNINLVVYSEKKSTVKFNYRSLEFDRISFNEVIDVPVEQNTGLDSRTERFRGNIYIF